MTDGPHDDAMMMMDARRILYCVTYTTVIDSRNRHPIVKGTVSYLSVIRVLIDNGVDINATDGEGTTALAWAIMRRDYELCEYLLSNNAHATPEQQNIIKRAKEGRGGIWWLSERREMGYPLSEKRKRVDDIVSRAVRRTRKRDYDKRQL